jgi:pilus assembly protein Flp/PilA
LCSARSFLEIKRGDGKMNLVDTGSEGTGDSQRGGPFGSSPPKGGEAGQGMIEYALILVLVAIAVIAVLSLLGTRLHDVFQNVINGLG